MQAHPLSTLWFIYLDHTVLRRNNNWIRNTNTYIGIGSYLSEPICA
jgi:hypothetical protein